jgi:hypothetical protein
VGASRVRYSVRQSVLVVEPLLPLGASDLSELTRSITKHLRLAQAQRVMLDARRLQSRALVSGEASDREFRDALTEWAITQTEPLALVVDDELHVAEINMASLGRGGLVRAFASTADAFRHASRAANRQGQSSENGSTGKHPAVGTDERRALLPPPPLRGRHPPRHAPDRSARQQRLIEATPPPSPSPLRSAPATDARGEARRLGRAAARRPRCCAPARAR